MLWGLLQQGRVDEDWALRAYAGQRLRLNQHRSNTVSEAPGPVQMFRASDGELFSGEADWRAYEAGLAEARSVDEWIAAQEANGQPFKRAQATRAKNLILSYIAYKNAKD